MSSLSDFMKDELGASAAEYALLLTIISAALLVTLADIGNTLANTFNQVATALAS